MTFSVLNSVARRVGWKARFAGASRYHTKVPHSGLGNDRAMLHVRFLSWLTVTVGLVILPIRANKAATQNLQAMVVAPHPAAATVGVEVLRAGGNAVDAAVATALMISVVEPFSAGIGGGGFALVYDASSQDITALDFRERAPLSATAAMYLDSAGNLIPRASLDGVLAAGTPGTIAGLAALHHRYGKLPWRQLVAPAIHAAEEGFSVTERYRRAATLRLAVLQADATARQIFLDQGQVPTLGTVIRQPDLAKTLGAIATNPNSFYNGWIATAIADFMGQSGGKMSRADLASYQPIWRSPVCGRYRGLQVCSMPPPSSGGVALIQMLNLLQALPPATTPTDRGHQLASVMQIAYADRTHYLGDSDFVAVPIALLTSPAYAQQRAREILPQQARPQSRVRAVEPSQLHRPESGNTSHLTVVDTARNAVSLTFTINGAFGAGVVVPQTGILLNNEMDDFAIAPNQPNLFGVVGVQVNNQPLANGISGGKRPLSSMTPTIVTRDGQLVMAMGSTGGSRIITAVLQLLLNIIDHGQDAPTALASPRLHQQWEPDVLFVEPGVSPEWLATWQQWGYTVVQPQPWGNANLIRVLDNGTLEGAADPRGEGIAAGF